MALPLLHIRITHTGLLPDARPNTNPVYIQDLDVGYEYQHRKVKVYVPVGGFIDIPASSRSLFSYEQGYIRKAVTAGLITATLYIQPETYTNATRPSPTLYPKGSYIWNDSDNAYNYSDGAGNWRDATGAIT
jgi:hypothetical protein